MSVQGRFSTSYTGVSATNPPNFYLMDRAPTPFDNQNFTIGDLWEHQINTGSPSVPNYSTSKIYHLAAQAQGVATWIAITSTGNPISLTGNSGGPVDPAAENINIIGSGSITVAGNPSTSTLTISSTVPAAVVETLTGNSGGAVSPSSNNISIVGSGLITVVGNPSTHTLTVSSSGSGDVIGINTIYVTATGSGTYTPSTGMVQCIVECVGGGCSSTSTIDGGPSGGYCKALFSSADIGSFQSYSVGVGGAAGGGNGGDTTFGSGPFMTAGGATSSGNLGGVSSGGDLNINGQRGGSHSGNSSSTPPQVSGAGGSTMYGLGGSMIISGSNAGTGYGSGTSGSASGTAGQPGIIIITEYIS